MVEVEEIPSLEDCSAALSGKAVDTCESLVRRSGLRCSLAGLVGARLTLHFLKWGKTEIIQKGTGNRLVTCTARRENILKWLGQGCY